MLRMDASATADVRGVPAAAPVALRPAVAADAPALRRLAGRETRSLPREPLLVAEREGRIDAAIGLRTGLVLADPFRPTADLRGLLRSYASALGAGRRTRRAAAR
jgi:hypothetical protein